MDEVIVVVSVPNCLTPLCHLSCRRPKYVAFLKTIPSDALQLSKHDQICSCIHEKDGSLSNGE